MFSVGILGAYAHVVLFLLLINFILAARLKSTAGFGKNETWIMQLILFGSLCSFFDALMVAFPSSEYTVAALQELGYWISYLCVLVPLLRLAFKNLSSKNANQNGMHPFVYLLPVVAGPVLQIFYHLVPITGMALTLAFVIIFMNNQENLIKGNIQTTKMLAALSDDYAAIHMVDLDNNSMQNLRISGGMKRMKVEASELPYDTAMKKLVEDFVMLDEREGMLAFLSRKSLKEKLQETTKLSFRYRVMEDEEEHYCYEMDIVRIGDKPDEHFAIIGTRCIDDILRIEREEGQYNAALLHDCEFFYGFDVTEGMIKNEFHVKPGYDPYFGLDIKLPISYDDFNAIRSEKLGMKASSKKEAEYWTCLGLKQAYESGKRTVDITYYSEKLNAYWTATVVFTEDQSTHHLHAVYIVKDMTELVANEKARQLELENALEEARAASAAKSDFLSKMSHDIRTPLNGIIGIMEINEKHADERELVDLNRQKAKVAANHLLSLINDILDMSKLEHDNTKIVSEPINLLDLLEECYIICDLKARDYDVTIVRGIADNLKYPYVYGSGLQLKQIVMNIIGNGIKYNKPGGKIYCRSFIESENDVNVVYRFEIEDTGIGMSQEYIEHIFEPFTQEKQDARSHYQGTGMGMAIVKALIDKMGGSISVRSTEGEGSTFTIILPFKINHFPENSLLTESKPAGKDISGKRILLVEDNELNMEIAKCILEDFGLIVTSAENGLIACEIFEEKPAGSFDGILMDIMMPELDGYDATRRIRQGTKSDAQTIPIIAMSANAFVEDVQNAKQSGMNDHLAKPVEVDKLKAMLEKYIG